MFATLALGSACATERAPSQDESATASDAGELAPLPKPTRLDPTEPSNPCPADLALITQPRVGLGGTAPLRQPVEPGTLEEVDSYSGSVEHLEYPISAKVAKEFGIEETRDAFRSATINVEGQTLRLVSKTRSLGLREGMSVEARETRSGAFSSSHYRLTIQTGDTTVFHYEHSPWTEDLRLPDGLLAERADFWCIWEYGHLRGELASLRITNLDGKNIVLQPGQTGSLGEYDIYVWNTLGPIGMERISLGGIDAEPAMIDIAVVRRF